MTRVIIYSGKGGTGKTTISASTATLLASQGKRTLVVSSDPAHSLADVIGIPIDREIPTHITDNLCGLEVDTIYEWRQNLGGFQQFVANTYSNRGIERSTAAELSTQPGLDEILALQRVMFEAQSGKWDAVVVDTAPTGNTLRLLAYPELIIGGDLGNKFFRVYRGLANMARPFRRDMPEDRFFDEIRVLLDQMSMLSEFLLSPDVSIRLVMNPDKLSLLETRRAYTFLNLYGLLLDAIIVNKILPAHAALGAYFDYWVNIQQTYLEEIDASFSPTPILKVPLRDSEPIGIEQLIAVGTTTFGSISSGDILYTERPIWLEQWNEEGEPGWYELCIYLPFLDNEQFNIAHATTDVTLIIGNGRLQRCIALPRILYDCKPCSHRYEDGVFRLEFRENTNGYVTPPYGNHVEAA